MLGRKSTYERWLTEEALLLLEGWAREGLIDEQIAAKMGISVRTLYTWKNQYPQISQAIKKGKDVVDFEVESALLRKALAGDTVACIFWLKNRKPERWRDKPEAPEAADEPLERFLEVMRNA